MRADSESTHKYPILITKTLLGSPLREGQQLLHNTNDPIAFGARQNISRLADTVDPKTGDCVSVWNNFWMANCETIFKESWFDIRVGSGPSQCNITNIRRIHAREIFAIMGKNQYAYYCIPESLLRLVESERGKPHNFLDWLDHEHPEILATVPGLYRADEFLRRWPPLLAEDHAEVARELLDRRRGDVVTPATFIRMFKSCMCHNGYQWREGLNICNDFDPEAKCGHGLYFIQNMDQDKWMRYNCMIMHYVADVIIPDDALVVVEHTYFGAKYKTNKIIIINLREIGKQC